MCIMEVSAQTRTDVMIQAEAHNTQTILSDFDMMVKVLESRNDDDCLNTVKHAQSLMNKAYALLLGEFGIQVAKVTQDAKGHLEHNGHVHTKNGHERTFVEEVISATKEAQLDETR